MVYNISKQNKCYILEPNKGINIKFKSFTKLQLYLADAYLKNNDKINLSFSTSIAEEEVKYLNF